MKMKKKKNEKSILAGLLNRIKLRNKFLVLFFFCVILPILVTDSFILIAVYNREVQSVNYELGYVAGVYQNYFENMLEEDMKLANSMDMNVKINDFLVRSYYNSYDYYSKYYDIIHDSFLETMCGLNSDSIVVYVDNKFFVDSQYFKRMEPIKDAQWYKDFLASDKKETIICYYEPDANPTLGEQKRSFKHIKKMTYNNKGEKDRVVVIDHNTNKMYRDLSEFESTYPLYVSCGDYVIYSNMGEDIHDVSEIEYGNKAPFISEFTMCGAEYRITIINNAQMIQTVLRENKTILIVLVIITILTPLIVINAIEKSIITRITKLEKAFGSEKTNTFTKITDVEGTDEIASLMNKYNNMVDITNNLITTVYKDKLKEQENDIARQKAELLALQSQINPHFLFNALESIRMHSFLKGEDETATMVGKLAIMERQNVEWGKDFVTIGKEMESIEAYLVIQGYRFGERLSFNIDVEKGCEEYLIPKLTIVTFVENACVHGIESKSTPGWIFVRVYKENDYLVIEVEDTGEGMSEEELCQVVDNINNVTIEAIKGKKHVGILNACLRLKMVTDKKVLFNVESEAGVGMSVVIKIPTECLDNIKQYEEK